MALGAQAGQMKLTEVIKAAVLPRSVASRARQTLKYR